MSHIRLQLTISALILSLTAACGGEVPPTPTLHGAAPTAAGPTQDDTDSTEAGTRSKHFLLPEGLDWLAEHQAADGGWSDDDDATPVTTDDLYLTGVAAYAFLASGFTNRGRSAKHRAAGLALQFLKRHQAADGRLAPRARPGTVRTHAPGAVALIEAYGRTGSSIYLKPAQGALDHLARECRAGRVHRAEVVGWTLLALRSARAINRHAATGGTFQPLALDERAFDRLPGWAEVARNEDYRRLAVAALARILFDPLESAHDRLNAVAKPLSLRPFAWSAEDGNTDPLASFFAGAALAFVPHEEKKHWQQATHTALSSKQASERDAPALLGSWSPDLLPGFGGGRVLLTALCSLIENRTRNPYSLPRIEDYR